MAALDVEAFLLPVKHLFNRLIDEATLRLATSPSFSDIIQPRTTQSESFQAKKCRIHTPLQLHTERFKRHYALKLQDVETIYPYTVPPDWTPPKLNIRSRKAAESAAKVYASTSLTSIYTDGSGINGKVEAAT